MKKVFVFLIVSLLLFGFAPRGTTSFIAAQNCIELVNKTAILSNENKTKIKQQETVAEKKMGVPNKPKQSTSMLKWKTKKTQNIAQEITQQRVESENKKIEITLISKNNKHKIQIENIDYSKTSFAILSSNRYFFKLKTLEDKINFVCKLKNNGLNLESAFNYVFPKISDKINLVKGKIDQAPIDATTKFNPYSETFSFTKEKPGIEVQAEEIYAKILYALINNLQEIKIETKIIFPKLTLEIAKKGIYKRAGYETSYESSSHERKFNIELALSKFNGKIIYPGKTLSFNETTGKRTSERGYKESKIILNGAYADGVGGGVCQASTTLYIGALLSGLNVVASRGHSIPAGYVPIGLDAMVNSFTSDMIIENNTKVPIAIKTECNGKTLKVEFFGENLGEFSYGLTTEKIKDLPPKNPSKEKKEGFVMGQKIRNGFDGFVYQSYRNLYKNGNLIETKKERKSTYESISEIVAT